ncbi:MAG TPA: hypothetical protein VM940_02195 [Chthoniobacterales bacterium]|jgi:hypothetical protein|nr:hypothetical protein [Chthoniobacterales bacterium]
MSLDSCAACGYALAIADQRCRHCSPGSTETRKTLQGLPLQLLLGLTALVFAVFIYRVFLS